jgi:hypothetical protein
MSPNRLPRTVAALLGPLLACAPAAAQPSEAWVLPRGMLEISAGGSYTHHDARLGGAVLGAPLLGAYRAATDRALLNPAAVARAGVAHVLASLPGNGAAGVDETVTPGVPAISLAADERAVPISLRYGLTRRITVFASLPVERRGTAVSALYLAGSTLGPNPAPDSNRAVLERAGVAQAGFGEGVLLPLSGSPAAVAVQARLRATGAGDTLLLPRFPLRLDEILTRSGLSAGLTPEERAALGLSGQRRPYAPGDLRVGARVLVVAGPSGWPHPLDAARGLRASIGVHGRVPTGRGGTTFLTEIPGDGGHAGFGGEARADLFLGRRWAVHAGVGAEQRLAADVVAVDFRPGRPFPGDTALRTLRREPGRTLEAELSPRWRLTEEITVEGVGLVSARDAVRYTAAGGEAATPPLLEWSDGGAAHAVGLGLRYSTLQAHGRDGGVLPYEVRLGFVRAVAGAAEAPASTVVQVTGRLFLDRRRLRGLVGRGSAPPPAPADTLAPPP